MFNLANYPLQHSFGRGRFFKRLGAKARFVCTRGPGSFCFSWHSRHADGESLVSADENVL